MTSATPSTAGPTHCPKCQHKRRPADPAPAGTCPACGLIFAKHVPRAERPVPLRPAQRSADESGTAVALGAVRRAFAVLFLLAGIVLGVWAHGFYRSEGVGAFEGLVVLFVLVLGGGSVLCLLVSVALAFGRYRRYTDDDHPDPSSLRARVNFAIGRVCVALLGASCAAVAVKGSFTGRIAFGSGSFRWATDSLAFLAAAAFWLVAGLGIMWFAWAMKSPRERE